MKGVIKTTAAVLLTMYLPIVTGEILTTSVTVVHLFHPLVFLVLTITYGFSMLLIHELTARWRLGLLGIFLLGLAFGLYSEGIAARTLLRSEHVPLDSFDHYSMALGLNLGFALVVSIWHALISVAVPLLVVQFFYPAEFQRPWLGWKVFGLLAAIALGLMSINFFCEPVAKGSSPPTVASYAIIALVTALLVAMARASSYLPQPALSSESKLTLKPFLLGFLFQGHLILAIVMSNAKVSLWVFYPVTVAVFGVFVGIIIRKGWYSNPSILLFGLGACLSHAALQAVGTIFGHRPPIYLVSSVVLMLAILLLAGILYAVHGRRFRQAGTPA